MSLASHVDKIRSLDSLLAEHEIIKREVSSLRELLDEEKRDLEQIRGGRRRAEPRQQHQPEDEDGNLQHDDDDDDAHSIATVTAHGLERVEEEDEEQLAVEEDEQTRRRDELTRPRTPEPTGLGMDDEDDKTRSRSRSPSPPPPITSQGAQPSSEDINSRLAALSNQLGSALELSRSLHTTAQNTISFLEAKVNALPDSSWIAIECASASCLTSSMAVPNVPAISTDDVARCARAPDTRPRHDVRAKGTLTVKVQWP